MRIRKGTRGTSKRTSNGISTNSLRMPRFPLALLAWARPVTLRSFVAVSGFLRFLPGVGFAEVDGISLYMDSSSVVSGYEMRFFPMIVQRRSEILMYGGVLVEQPLSIVTGTQKIRIPIKFGNTCKQCCASSITVVTVRNSYISVKDGYRLMGAQEASELASLAVIEQGLCKRDADDPAAANVFHSPSIDRLLWSVRSPVK
jgi:hypothetical protein